MTDTEYTVEGPFVERTPEGSYFEAYLTVNGAKFQLAVMKAGELDARIMEAAAEKADHSSEPPATS